MRKHKIFKELKIGDCVYLCNFDDPIVIGKINGKPFIEYKYIGFPTEYYLDFCDIFIKKSDLYNHTSIWKSENEKWIVTTSLSLMKEALSRSNEDISLILDSIYQYENIKS